MVPLKAIEFDLLTARLARDAAEHANVLKERLVEIQQGHRHDYFEPSPAVAGTVM